MERVAIHFAAPHGFNSRTSRAVLTCGHDHARKSAWRAQQADHARLAAGNGRRYASPMSFVWIDALQRLRAIAQTGLTYGVGPYDLERYAEIMSIVDRALVELLRATPQAVAENYALAKGYPTPKLDVRAAVFVEDRVLLVRETADGQWTLPGGWVNETDSPREAAEREVHEESGYRVRVTQLVAIKDRNRHAYRPKMLGGCYKLLFLAEFQGGTATTSIETSAVAFFPIDELPPLSEGRTLPDDIREAYAAHLDPGIQPVID